MKLKARQFLKRISGWTIETNVMELKAVIKLLAAYLYVHKSSVSDINASLDNVFDKYSCSVTSLQENRSEKERSAWFNIRLRNHIWDYDILITIVKEKQLSWRVIENVTTGNEDGIFENGKIVF